MGEVREIPEGRTELAAAAMFELRPQWRTPEALVEVIDARLRPAGYRLVGVFEDGVDDARAVAGFRVSEALAWGRHLYVDDLATLPSARGSGHGEQLIAWCLAEAARSGCEQFHLDSGVGPDRAAAHRLYMRQHLRISAHHFQRDVPGP